MDMDTSGLDLGKILKMVTDNPAMLQTALSFAGKLKDSTVGAVGADTQAKERSQEAPTPTVLPVKTEINHREQEKQLLTALRPYLNETRQDKIDFVLKILQLLELAGTLGFTLDGKMKGGTQRDVQP